MSLALNERIQKLKNDLKGTTYPDNDAAKRRENNQVLL